MQIPQWLDLLSRFLAGAGGVAAIGAAWRVTMWGKRMDGIFKDFPPHHHINGKISYPKGFEPPLVERLHAGD